MKTKENILKVILSSSGNIFIKGVETPGEIISFMKFTSGMVNEFVFPAC
jgi:hypothetical protein